MTTAYLALAFSVSVFVAIYIRSDPLNRKVMREFGVAIVLATVASTGILSLFHIVMVSTGLAK